MARKSQSSGEEKRKAHRLEIQESFNLCLVIPKVFSMARLYVKDVSALGICVRNDLPAKIDLGEVLETRLYFNPGFYLPLSCRLARHTQTEIALEFVDSSSREAKAVAKLQEFIEQAEKAGVFIA